MSAEKTTLEIIAPSVEEAVQKGLEQLNLTEDAVDVEVLDAGSRGLFGIGSRQARVRLAVRGGESTPAVVERPAAKVDAPAAVVEKAETVKPARSAKPVEKPVEELGLHESEEEIPEEDILFAAKTTVADLLDKMKVKATISASMRPAEDADDEDTVVVNIEGDDLSILIGRLSETLNALQYITSLIVGKRLNRWVPLVIDVQGYRARRERQLRVLARRMAEQASHTGKRQVLEPMPANERRVIHLELRDHPQVSTESIGDDPNRKVTIVPKH
ncbi:MAG: Jag N-terminal domain-containing protein [Anaerolineae bacterium]|nr:Jag N-terminal domain-containing protein [Anaerolineae bacterium]